MRAAAARAAPYALLGALALAYFVSSASEPKGRAFAGLPTLWYFDFLRPIESFDVLWRGTDSWNFASELLLVLGFSAFLLAPVLLGLELQRDRRCLVPFVTLLALSAFAPDYAMSTVYFHERFALFLMPFYALMFSAAPARRRPAPRWLRAGVSVALPSICFGICALRCWQNLEFEREASDYRVLEDAIPEGRRVLSLVFDSGSNAMGSTYVYTHFPVWYQVRKHGLVEPSFAQVSHQVVRFGPGAEGARSGLEWHPEKFDWKLDRGDRFDYFVVRRGQPLPPGFFDAPCEVSAVASAGAWTLYRGCR